MSYVPIYLPDGSLGVDWYVSEDKLADGVERISESWVRREVGPRRDTGFRAEHPSDPLEIVGGGSRPRPRPRAVIAREPRG